MKASERLLEHIRQSEGYRLRAYKDAAGVWTIGYGHTKDVQPGQRIDKATVERYLREDLSGIEEWLSKKAWCDTQGKFDACADFIFNLGLGRFMTSTLQTKIWQGAPTEEIQKEFRRWVYAGGRVMPGLVKRREWEARRWTEED